MNVNPKISVILPCRNEEKALPLCLREIKRVISENNLSAEIVVSDSSIDKSPEIAKKEGVILLKHDKEGYGNAYLEAFNMARGKYILMADADGSYDFNDIPKFIKELEKGYDLVIGNRFSGKMVKNSMSFSHRYIGNPLLSSVLRMFFGTKIKDSQCGIRAIRKEALDKLNLRTTGMEFASEMIIKALKRKLKIKEIPTSYFKRIGKSKLNSFSDAWRHLRFMLLYSPLFLFFIPGIMLFLLGLVSFTLIYFSALEIFGRVLDIHPLFASSVLIIMGYQLIFFSIFARTYAYVHLRDGGGWLKKAYRYFNLETGSISGILMIMGGLILYLFIFQIWAASGFGALNQIKNLILGLTLIVLGIQTIFSSFMLSILGIRETNADPVLEKKDYWSKRKNLNYYEEVIKIAKNYAGNANSVLDVGSSNCEYILDLDWIQKKTAIDISSIPSNPNIHSIKADFLKYSFKSKFDLVLCLQVLEHLKDPKKFAKKLFSLGRVVIISVPYKWPKGFSSQHIQDPIDKSKVLTWTKRTPDFSVIITDKYLNRWVGVYLPKNKK